MAGQTFPPLAQDGVMWRGWIEKELQTAWEAELWPDLLRTEQRYLRDLFIAGNSYVPGNEVYDPTQKKYFQAIYANDENPPPDLAFWAESKLSYSAPDFNVLTTYAPGAQVYFPGTDTYHQCHATSLGHFPPTETNFWGTLVPFIPDIAYEQTGKSRLGDVVGVWNKNPRVYTTAYRIPFRLTERGVSLLGGITASLWVEYRIRPLKFFGDVFDALVSYAADQQVYLSPDFYTCLTTTLAGESPVTNPAEWAVVAIPEIFKAYVLHAAYVRWLRSDGQNDKAVQESGIAAQELVRQAISLARTQRQSRGLEVLTR